MVDYDKTTGTTGTMRIKDLGSSVEFWIKAGYTFYWNGLKLSTDIPGGSLQEHTVNYPSGTAWFKVATRTVSTSGTVTFKLLTTTGTQGMGGPTTHSVYIDRASKPSPPSTPSTSSVGATSVTVSFNDGANNGAAITSRQVGYGTNASTVQSSVSVGTNRTVTISGLAKGTTYYFWARTYNEKGWSNYSGRASAKTLNNPAVPTTPTISNVKNTSFSYAFSDGANNGASITTRQIGWSTGSTAPTSTATSGTSGSITGLVAGTTYYVWARTYNSVGWSDWSGRASVKLPRQPDVPSAVVLSLVTQVSLTAKFSANGDGGSAFTGHDLAYNTSNTTSGATVLSSNGTTNLTGLIPGVTYYFWSRSKNQWGASGWSAVKSVRTIGGVTVWVGTTPKQAVAYRNVNGVWKVCQSWRASGGGSWKPTI